MNPRNIVKIVLVLVVSGLTFADQECPENAVPDQIIEVVECSGTCFEVVKPFLSYFRELKTGADKGNEFKSKLMEVLKEVEIKDQLIETLNATLKSKDEQSQTLIKSKDEQINTLKALIESRKYLRQAQSGNVMLIRTIKSEINNKTYEIFNKDTLINSLNVKINEKNEEIKKNGDEKAESNKKLLSCLDNVNKNEYTLLENERKIQENQKEIKSKDEQINTLTKNNDALIGAQIESKDLIRIKNSEISERNNEILLLNQAINKKDKEVTKLNLKVKELEELHENEQKKYSDEKDEFNKNLIKNNHTLIEKENEIQENKKEIQRKDELLKKKDKEIQEKTDQSRNLTREINVICQNLTKTNVKLSICDGINFCITAEKGIYNIKLPGMSAFDAPCNGSGWTVIQRRMDGSVDFNRSWTEYRDGFGNLTGEFFIGLEKLHQITQSGQCELLISLGKVNGSRDFVKYDNFKIGSEENSYLLESVGNFTGGAGDSLQYDVNMKFSTIDRDNDMTDIDNCPDIYKGGWWFNNCGPSSLNGLFFKNGKRGKFIFGIIWGSWQEWKWDISLTFVEMMIRPKPF